MSATILMIDDDAALLRLVELNLTQDGYTVITALHGIAGVQACRRWSVADRPWCCSTSACPSWTGGTPAG